jgi:single-strand DNA-binding protein
MNKVMLIGNLTRDSELRHLPSGTPVLGMGIAVNDRRKNGQTGQWEDRPNFFNLTMMGERAEKISGYLTKGKKVAVVGKLEYRAWENQAGEKRSTVEVFVEDIEFLSSQNEGGGGGGGSYQPRESQSRPAGEAPSYSGSPSDDLGGIDVNDEEIPF